MATFEELVNMVDKIANASDVAEVKTELAEVKTALATNTSADGETKLTADQNRILLEKIFVRLGDAPAPTVPVEPAEEPTT